MNKHTAGLAVTLIAAVSAAPAFSKQLIFSDGDKKLEVGGRVHLQYLLIDPDQGGASDDVGFRRLRVEFDANLSARWAAQFEWDVGEGNGLGINRSPSDSQLVDGYIEYRPATGGKLQIGYTRVIRFGRSDLTSSNYSHQVERTLAGSTDAGNPSRQTGIGWLSKRDDQTQFVWNLGVAMAEIDPANNQIDFDSAVDSEEENSEGFIAGGRLQYFPLGHFEQRQDNFSGNSRLGFALAAFNWANNGKQRGLDPNNPDIEDVTGIELSAAYRGYGWSVDAQYNKFDAQAVTDDLPKISGNTIFEVNGEADLDVYAIEAGYMVKSQKLQIAASFAVQDAKPYVDRFVQTQVGMTYYISQHDIKVQASYRRETSVNGVNDNDRSTLYVQMQYLY